MPWDHHRIQDHAGMQEPTLGWAGGVDAEGKGRVSRGAGGVVVRRRRGEHEAAGELISP